MSAPSDPILEPYCPFPIFRYPEDSAHPLDYVVSPLGPWEDISTTVSPDVYQSRFCGAIEVNDEVLQPKDDMARCDSDV